MDSGQHPSPLRYAVASPRAGYGWQSTLCRAQGGSKVKDKKDEKDEKDEKDRGTGYSVGKRPGITQKHRVQKKNAASEP